MATVIVTEYFIDTQVNKLVRIRHSKAQHVLVILILPTDSESENHNSNRNRSVARRLTWVRENARQLASKGRYHDCR